MAATDLNGVLQDLGVTLNPTQAAFLIQASPAAPPSLPSTPLDLTLHHFGQRRTFSFKGELAGPELFLDLFGSCL